MASALLLLVTIRPASPRHHPKVQRQCDCEVATREDSHRHQRSRSVCQDRRSGRCLRRPAGRAGNAGARAGADPAGLSPGAGTAGIPSSRPASSSKSPSAARSFAAACSRATCPRARCRSISSSRTTTSIAPDSIAKTIDDYKDNCERFVFFSRAVIEAIRLFDLEVDVLHANDWQTGLAARVSQDRISRRARLRTHRHPVHDPQHGLPGRVLALGHAADRAWIGSTSTGSKWSFSAI